MSDQKADMGDLADGSNDNGADQGSLTDTLQRVRSISHDGDVTVGEVVEAVGSKGILPAVLLPALIAATPLSGIPGLSALCGVLIALFSFELLFRFRHLYLPQKLRGFSIEGHKLRKWIDKVMPWFEWVEKHTGDRMRFLFHRPMIWLPQALCLLSGMLMPLLEVIPFSSSIMATGVCLLVMAMLTRDGVFAILALIPYGGAIYLATRFLA